MLSSQKFVNLSHRTEHMLRNRLEGLVSLHSIWVSILATAGFYLFVLGTQATGWMRLASGFNRNLYYLAVLTGMLMGSRVFLGWADRLSRLGWIDSLYVTAQILARLALVLFGTAFVTKDTYVSRIFLGAFLAMVGVGLVVANRYLPRVIAKFVFKSHSIPTIIVGTPASTPGFEQWLASQAKIGVDVLGCVTKRNEHGTNGVRLLGFVGEIEQVLADNPASQIVMPLFYLDASDTKHVMSVAREAGCRVRLVENFDEGLKRPLSMERTDFGIGVISDGNEPLQNPVNRGIKRAFDVAVALPVVLFVLPPLTLLVAVMQKLQSPGPVYFRQVRYGVGRKPFLIFKFRTMHVASQNAEQEKVQAKKGDSRVFAFGRFMRKASLDEMPQFLNVLFGTMSVAGPRPHLVQHDDEFARLVDDYRMRHFVKPGITGLAQCNGYRGEITNVGLLLKRAQHDIAYVRSWTPILDIAIVLRTARQVLFPPKSAY
jgi:exopolysaccharide biosynthesis polyprenyl glycosylphosphotransferase